MTDDVSVEERLSAIFAIEGRNWPQNPTDCFAENAYLQIWIRHTDSTAITV